MDSTDKPSRIGRPQVYALLLLLCFAAQCWWTARHAPLDEEERRYAARFPIVAPEPPRADRFHSPLIYDLADVPRRSAIVPAYDWIGAQYRWRFVLRMPFILFGLLRGASLWYVSRRLFGNRGAYLALALYCFSPRMVAEASHVWPDVLAAWGFFGAIFVGIASAHTLYALPETIPWQQRWRRPILMGIALGVGIAAQYSVWLALPLALAFILYLVPGRRAEGAAMIALSCAIAAGVLVACFAFRWGEFADALGNAVLFRSPAEAISRYAALGASIRQTNPAFLALCAVALAAWVGWRRARYFANTAALTVMAAVPLVAPVYPGDQPYRLWIPGIAFLFMFCGGVFADLFETRRGKLSAAIATALVVADAGFGLVRVFR